MKKVLIVVGPTAVGKTVIAVKLAQEFGGVLHSADSVQAYSGLDIISGKDLPALSNTSIHLIDVVSPTDSFSVSDFILAFKKTFKALPKSVLPIIVGGTAFYVSALLNGIETIDIKPNKKLRRSLENKNVRELQEILASNNLEKLYSMNNSDRNNPRRLVRAIEIALESQNTKIKKRKDGILESFDTLIIGLMAPRKILTERIEKRVEERLKNGAINEALKLFEKYDFLAPQIKTANGYKQLFAYLKNEVTCENAIENWKTAEIQNAKKQMTFFKKMKGIKWFNIQDSKFNEKVQVQVKKWYNTDI